MLNLGFESTSSSIGLWTWSVAVGGIPMDDSDSVLRNAGFGVLVSGLDAIRSGYYAPYPQATYQFLR